MKQKKSAETELDVCEKWHVKLKKMHYFVTLALKIVYLHEKNTRSIAKKNYHEEQMPKC